MKILQKFNKKYFFYSCGAFSVGLAVSAFFGFNYFYIAVLIFSFLFLVCFIFKNFVKTKGLLCFFLAAIFGAAFFTIYTVKNYKLSTSFIGQEKTINGRITEIDECGNGNKRYILKVKKIGDSCFIFPLYIKFYSKVSLDAQYMDDVSFDAKIGSNAINENFAFLNDAVSSACYLFISDMKNFVTLKRNNSFIKNILNFKKEAKNIIYNNMKKPYSDIAKGIFFGGSSSIKYSLKRIASRCGVMHIFAVSGLHINILISFLAIILKFFRAPLKLSFIILSFCLLTYLVFVGFSPSAVRAVLMAFTIYFGIVFKKHVNGLYALFFASFIILIFNPLAIYGTSFLLSFSSCFGIITLSKKINNSIVSLISFDRRWFRYIVNQLSNSLAATIGCSFFLVFRFGNLSLFGPIVNIFILPLVPIFYFASFSIIIFGLFNSSISGFIGDIYSNILKIVFDILKNISDISFCSVAANYMFVKTAVLGIIFFVIVCLLFFRKFIFTKTFFTISFNIFSFSMLINFLVTKDHTNITVIRQKNEAGVLIRHKGKTILLDCGLSEKTYEKTLEYFDSKGINNIDILFLTNRSKIKDEGKESIFKFFPVSYVRLCGNFDEDFNFDGFNKNKTNIIDSRINHLEIFPILIDIKEIKKNFVIYLNINGVCIAYFEKISMIDEIDNDRYINLAILCQKLKENINNYNYYSSVFKRKQFGQILSLYESNFEDEQIISVENKNLFTEFVIDRNIFRKDWF